MVGGGAAVPSEGVILGIRPEDLELAPAGTTSETGLALPLSVDAVERVGPESFVYGALTRGGDVIVRLPGARVPAPGDHAVAVADRSKLHVFAADGRRRIDA
jgi:sn-glycerol 3-phosphate transport system ATP-binding protein